MAGLDAVSSFSGIPTDAEESVRNLEAFIRMFFAQQPSDEDLYLMLGYNVCVPPRVREALFSRSVNNDDLLPKIRKPVLITHGALDAIVRPIVVDRYKTAMPHAQIHSMQNCGHAPFWEDAAEFNRRLRAFAEGL
jgi:non-heme chloroperoxidase